VDQQLRAMMRRTTVEGYRAYVGAFIEMDFSVQLGELTVPVMLVAAEHDHGGGPVEDMREDGCAHPLAQSSG
jgi:3-oxoadipate enol-lactonase